MSLKKFSAVVAILFLANTGCNPSDTAKPTLSATKPAKANGDLTVNQSTSNKPTLQLNQRRILLPFKVHFSIHDDSRLLLISDVVSNDPIPRMIVVDIASAGYEYIAGEASLPQPGNDSVIVGKGLSHGQVYLLMKWREGKGLAQAFSVQLFSKPMSDILDSAKPWQVVGQQAEAPVQVQFDPYSPFVYWLGSNGMKSKISRMDLRTGEWQDIAGNLDPSIFSVTKDYLVLTTTMCCNSKMTVIDKATLQIVGTDDIGEIKNSYEFYGAEDAYYFARVKMGSSGHDFELVTRSGPNLSNSQVIPDPLGSLAQSHFIKNRVLMIEGSYNQRTNLEIILDVKFFNLRDNSICNLGQLTTKNWYKTNDYVVGKQPRLFLTGQFPENNELVIADINPNQCN